MSSVTDRIRKLLALSASSNEHEARRALAKAQELMIRHGIESVDPDDNSKSVCVYRINFSHTVPYIDGLFFGMLDTEYRCRCYRGRDFLLLAAASRDDLDACCMAVNFAIKVCKKLWKKYWNELDRRSIRNREKTRTAYCCGFALAIQENNSKHRETQNLPALVVPATVTDHMAHTYKVRSYKDSKSQSAMSSHGDHAFRGYCDGHRSNKISHQGDK